MDTRSTYHFIAGVLALDGNKPSDDSSGLQHRRSALAETIRSGKVDWDRFVLLGSNNYVLQALYLKFSKHRMLGELPGELTSHLRELYDLNLERNTTILEHTSRINSLLTSNNITPIFMKGLGNMLDGLYSSPGERMMLDIDILAEPRKMEEAAKLLISDGFTSTYQFDPGREEAMKHFPELVKEGLPAFVDIHRMPVNIQYESVFSYETAAGGSRPSLSDGRYTVMSDSHKIKLNFIHSQLVHWGHYHARPSLRDLYDLYLLSGRDDPAAVLTSFSPYRGKAAGYLALLHHTFGAEKEPAITARLSSRLYLARHRLAMDWPRTGKMIFLLLRAVRIYIVIPFLAIFDKNYRTYVKVRLRDPEWYRRNLGVRRILKRKDPPPLKPSRPAQP